MRFSEMSKVCWDNQTLVLPDLDLGSRKVTHPTKLGVPSNFCLIKFLPKTWLRLQNPWGPGTSRSGLGVQNDDLPPLNQGPRQILFDKVFAKLHG